MSFFSPEESYTRIRYNNVGVTFFPLGSTCHVNIHIYIRLTKSMSLTFQLHKCVSNGILDVFVQLLRVSYIPNSTMSALLNITPRSLIKCQDTVLLKGELVKRKSTQLVLRLINPETAASLRKKSGQLSMQLEDISGKNFYGRFKKESLNYMLCLA